MGWGRGNVRVLIPFLRDEEVFVQIARAIFWVWADIIRNKCVSWTMKIILQAEEINLFGLQNKIKRGGCA